ncbi:MAG: SGNH/GDSL hydrolase family protein [Spirochaetaceae bacterium]|jgi:lysophospholipase L1-like esterase|nr:SGNH/GDSL hydrolase family protein [Spirochaetaceae bacterium]
MKTILCYGDSNTWGYNPQTGERYDHKTRWPMALKNLLNRNAPGDESPDDPRYWVDEEGLCGRTSCREDPVEGDMNGLRQLMPILKSHSPLDIVVVMLGTNDLKIRYSPCAYDIARGVGRLVTAVKDSRTGPGDTAPQVLMICPPPTADAPAFKNIFGDSVELSKKLPGFYRRFAEECGAEFLDAGKIIQSSKADGIHLDPEEHYKLAAAVADRVKKMEPGM